MSNYFERYPISQQPAPNVILFGEIKKCKVAYIVTTYKRLDMLIRCIQSLSCQKCKYDYQIIINDNDIETIDFYHKNKQRYQDLIQIKNVVYSVNLHNIGGHNNLNQGAFIAQADFICFVHDDDVVHPKHLTEMIRVIENNPDQYYIGTGLYVLDTIKDSSCIQTYLKSAPLKINEVTSVSFKQLYKNYVNPMLGAIIKRDKFIEMGGLGADCCIEDYIFTCRFTKDCGSALCNSRLYGYVIQDNDSLKASVCEKVICEKYKLRQLINKKEKLFSRPKNWLLNHIYLARDIAYYESKKNTAHVNISRKVIKKEINVNLFILRIGVVFAKLVRLINNK